MKNDIQWQNVNLAIEKFDLCKYLDYHGIRYFVSSSDQLMFPCPSCRAHDKFYVHLVSKLYLCFKCEIRGNFFKLISLISPDDKSAIGQVLGKNRRIDLNEILKFQFGTTLINNDESSDKIRLSMDFCSPIDCYDKNAIVNQYLTMRGISKEMVCRFDLRYSAELRRLIFPIYTHENGLLGWVGRDITGFHKLKYFNNAGLKKSHVLYGQNLHWGRESIVLVEGPIDALKSLKFGGLALLGKSMSQNQLNLLLAMPNLRSIHIGIDPDQPECAESIAKVLSSFFNISLVKFDSFKDFGDRDETNIDNLLRHSISFRNESELSLFSNLCI